QAGQPRRGPQVVPAGDPVAGEERGSARQGQGAGRGTPPLPKRGGRSPGAEEEVTAIGLENKAAGGALTAKQAPHRPRTAPAPGLRAGRAVVIPEQATLQGRFPCGSALCSTASCPAPPAQLPGRGGVRPKTISAPVRFAPSWKSWKTARCCPPTW